MTLSKHMRTLAAAALLALTMVGAAVGPAHAEQKKPTDDADLCTTTHTEADGETHIEFELPGTIITRIDARGVGHRYECKGGEWVEVKQVVPATVIQYILGQTGPRPVLHEVPSTGPTFGVASPVGGGVFAQR